MGHIINKDQDNKTFYDSISEQYDNEYHPESRYKEYTTMLIKRFIRKHIRKKGSNIEIGHGTGVYTSLIAENSGTLLAVDISPHMQEICKKKIKANNISFLLCDIYRLCKITQCKYDTIILIALMPHLKDMAAALSNMCSMLHEDGILIFDLWNSNSHFFKGLEKWREKVLRSESDEERNFEAAFTSFMQYDEMIDLINDNKLNKVDELCTNAVAFTRFPRSELFYPVYPVVDRLLSSVCKKRCYEHVFACNKQK